MTCTLTSVNKTVHVFNVHVVLTVNGQQLQHNFDVIKLRQSVQGSAAISKWEVTRFLTPSFHCWSRLVNSSDGGVLVNVTADFQDRKKRSCTRSPALLEWCDDLINRPWVMGSELPPKEAAQMWCWTAVTISGHKKDIRVSNVSRLLIFFASVWFLSGYRAT